MPDFSNIEFPINIPYHLRVYFTKNAFASRNPLLRDTLCSQESGARKKVLIYIDQSVQASNPDLETAITAYFKRYESDLRLSGIVALSGGEALKNDDACLDRIYKKIEELKICRHSYIVAVGGGALLDTVGFAAATAHRGIRHIRFPTTTLGQGDAGVGVKNGVNFNGKKNFVGSFAPPFAVINDFDFLKTLSAVHMRNGFIEAIKVALIRDAAFFDWIEANAEELKRFDQPVIEELIQRSARHHVEHIASSGDPFEMGSVRPLDFGHWAAHKLEQMSQFHISHGEAVAIGIAIDTLYSQEMGFLKEACANRILTLLSRLNFEIFSDLLQTKNGSRFPYVLEGLEEFREHLGGTLTVTLLKKIGRRFEVHEMNTEVVINSIHRLKELA